MDTDLTLGFSAGGDDYLSKPFSNAELLSRVLGDDDLSLFPHPDGSEHVPPADLSQQVLSSGQTHNLPVCPVILFPLVGI